jgi:hypothetical protein
MFGENADGKREALCHVSFDGATSRAAGKR